MFRTFALSGPWVPFNFTFSISTRLLSSILFYFLGSWVPRILQLTLKNIYTFFKGLLKSLVKKHHSFESMYPNGIYFGRRVLIR